MKDSEKKDCEWVKPLNEYLYKISVVTSTYEPEVLYYLIKHIQDTFWHSDNLESKGLIEEVIQEIEQLKLNLPELFSKVRGYTNRFDNDFTQKEIVEITSSQLKLLLTELKSLQKALLRKIKASLPNGIEKDGVRIKSHATAETLVAFFKALQAENVIFDKDLSNIYMAKFISANFSTSDSTSKPLSVEHLENLFSSNNTSASRGFIEKLKNILKNIQ